MRMSPVNEDSVSVRLYPWPARIVLSTGWISPALAIFWQDAVGISGSRSSWSEVACVAGAWMFAIALLSLPKVTADEAGIRFWLRSEKTPWNQVRYSSHHVLGATFLRYEDSTGRKRFVLAGEHAHQLASLSQKQASLS